MVITGFYVLLSAQIGDGTTRQVAYRRLGGLAHQAVVSDDPAGSGREGPGRDPADGERAP